MESDNDDEDILLALSFAGGADEALSSTAVISAAATSVLPSSNKTPAPNNSGPIGFADFISGNTAGSSAGAAAANAASAASAPAKHASRPSQVQGAAAVVRKPTMAEVDLANKEEHSMLSIKNRVIPAAEVKMSLLGRKIHSIRTISKMNHAQLDKTREGRSDKGGVDWVTIGVLAAKSAPRNNGRSKGNYMSWTLSDFRASLNVMLFGDAYATHWSEAVGSIVLLSGAVLLPARDGKAAMYSTSRGAQIVKLGTSTDFGICHGICKDGKKCSIAINTTEGNFCVQHVTAEYKRELVRAGRSDLMSLGSGGKVVNAARSSQSAYALPVQRDASLRHVNASDGTYGHAARQLIKQQASAAAAAAATQRHSSRIGEPPMSHLPFHTVGAGDDDGYGFTGPADPATVAAAAAEAAEAREREAFGLSGPYRAQRSHVLDVKGAAGLKVRVSGDVSGGGSRKADASGEGAAASAATAAGGGTGKQAATAAAATTAGRSSAGGGGNDGGNSGAKGDGLQARTATYLGSEFRHAAMGSVSGVGTRLGAVDAVRFHAPTKADRHANLLGVDRLGNKIGGEPVSSSSSVVTKRPAAPTTGIPEVPTFNSLVGGAESAVAAVAESAAAGRGGGGGGASVRASKRPAVEEQLPLLRVENGVITEIRKRKTVPVRVADDDGGEGVGSSSARALGKVDLSERDKVRIVTSVENLRRSGQHTYTNGQRLAGATAGVQLARSKGSSMGSALVRCLTAARPEKPPASSLASQASQLERPHPSSAVSAAVSADADSLAAHSRSRVDVAQLERSRMQKTAEGLLGGGGGSGDGSTTAAGPTRPLTHLHRHGLASRLALQHVPSRSGRNDSEQTAFARVGMRAAHAPRCEDPLGDLLGGDADNGDDEEDGDNELLPLESNDGAGGQGQVDGRMIDLEPTFDDEFDDEELMRVALPESQAAHNGSSSYIISSSSSSSTDICGAVASSSPSGGGCDEHEHREAPEGCGRSSIAEREDELPLPSVPASAAAAALDVTANPAAEDAEEDGDAGLPQCPKRRRLTESPAAATATAAAGGGRGSNGEVCCDSSSPKMAVNGDAGDPQDVTTSPAAAPTAAAAAIFEPPQLHEVEIDTAATAAAQPAEFSTEESVLAASHSRSLSLEAVEERDPVSSGNSGCEHDCDDSGDSDSDSDDDLIIVPSLDSKAPVLQSSAETLLGTNFLRRKSSSAVMIQPPVAAPLATHSPASSALLRAKLHPPSAAAAVAMQPGGPQGPVSSPLMRIAAAEVPRKPASSTAVAAPVSLAVSRKLPQQPGEELLPAVPRKKSIVTISSLAAPVSLAVQASQGFSRSVTGSHAQLQQQRRPATFAEAETQQRRQLTEAVKQQVRESGGIRAASSPLPAAAAAAAAAARLPLAASSAPASSSAAAIPVVSRKAVGGTGGAAAAAAASSAFPAATAAKTAPARVVSGGKRSGAAPAGSFCAVFRTPDVSLTSAEAKRALAVTSLNAEDGNRAVLARALDRVDAGAKLEAIEARLAEVDSRTVTKWFCMDCSKWFYSKPPMCLTESHELHPRKKTEWRFACDSCGFKLFHDSELCVVPCPKCQHSRWTKTSVHNLAAKTDRLPTEGVLHTHGEPVTESLRHMGEHAF